MTGRDDLAVQAAEARPQIAGWLTGYAFACSLMLLAASGGVLFLAVQQHGKLPMVAAVKPSGEPYEAGSYATVGEAQRAAPAPASPRSPSLAPASIKGDRAVGSAEVARVNHHTGQPSR